MAIRNSITIKRGAGGPRSVKPRVRTDETVHVKPRVSPNDTVTMRRVSNPSVPTNTNNGGYLNSREYKNAMARAYNTSSYYGGKGIAAAQDDELDNFLKGLSANKPVDDGGAAAAAAARAAQIQAMVNSIEETYGRQRSSLDTNKATSLGGITSAYDTARGNIGRNQADYDTAAASSQAAMTQRMAEQLSQMQSRDAELQNSAQLMGQNAGVLQSQSTGNMDAMKASSGLQEDLSRRMAEVVANNSRMAQNSGDLVRQGATGNLENQYNGLLNALMTQREQDLLNARTGNFGNSGSGGGRSSSDKLTSAELKVMREQDLIDSACSQSILITHHIWLTAKPLKTLVALKMKKNGEATRSLVRCALVLEQMPCESLCTISIVPTVLGLDLF
jgi:hypothetical protein